MHGKTSRLTSLAARKKLLLVESNLNRALLVADIARIKMEIRGLSEKVFSTGLLAAGAVPAGAAVKGLFDLFFHRERPREEPRKTWFSRLSQGVKVGSLIWSFLRSQKR